ncbi:MAG: hypothetical protein M1828_001619 [Chrysothrix sp. TS-e1954]|nr:MAG: hypothetical protein M1828_001619 [Chrysothrix sp. TS-e1954]
MDPSDDPQDIVHPSVPVARATSSSGSLHISSDELIQADDQTQINSADEAQEEDTDRTPTMPQGEFGGDETYRPPGSWSPGIRHTLPQPGGPPPDPEVSSWELQEHVSRRLEGESSEVQERSSTETVFHHPVDSEEDETEDEDEDEDVPDETLTFLSPDLTTASKALRQGSTNQRVGACEPTPRARSRGMWNFLKINGKGREKLLTLEQQRDHLRVQRQQIRGWRVTLKYKGIHISDEYELEVMTLVVRQPALRLGAASLLPGRYGNPPEANSAMIHRQASFTAQDARIPNSNALMVTRAFQSVAAFAHQARYLPRNRFEWIYDSLISKPPGINGMVSWARGCRQVINQPEQFWTLLNDGERDAVMILFRMALEQRPERAI